jgi:hypothetical protein
LAVTALYAIAPATPPGVEGHRESLTEHK